MATGSLHFFVLLPIALRLLDMLSGSARRVLFTLLLIDIMWAPTYFATKVAQQQLSPSALAVVRWSLISIVIWLAYLVSPSLRTRHMKMPSRAGKLASFSTGLLLTSTTYLLFGSAILNTTTVEVSILSAAYPVLMASMAAFGLAERLSRRRMVAVAFGGIGAYVLVCGFALPASGHSNHAANLLYLSGMVIECFALLVAARVARQSSGLGAFAWQSLGASIGCFLLALGFPESLPLRIDNLDLSTMLSILYLSTVGGALAFGLWYTLMREVPVSFMAISNVFQPLIACILGIIYLRETVSSATLAGAGLLVFSIAIAATEKNLGLARRKVPGYEAG